MGSADGSGVGLKMGRADGDCVPGVGAGDTEGDGLGWLDGLLLTEGSGVGNGTGGGTGGSDGRALGCEVGKPEGKGVGRCVGPPLGGPGPAGKVSSFT